MEYFPFGREEVRAVSDHRPVLYHTKPPKGGPSIQSEKRTILKRIEEIRLKEGSIDWPMEFQVDRQELKQRLFHIIEIEDRALRLKCISSWAREGDVVMTGKILV
ncbi:hypothetical protein L484_015401 [Morus notabilis]|uniref:Uncharacterized protein n=1 Tax=Morus notabilis TaxID=981085 RepID=W9RFV3_9ROSA|nr:hypothetical protein L484_015401 [Morus notabilis]